MHPAYTMPRCTVPQNPRHLLFSQELHHDQLMNLHINYTHCRKVPPRSVMHAGYQIVGRVICLKFDCMVYHTASGCQIALRRIFQNHSVLWSMQLLSCHDRLWLKFWACIAATCSKPTTGASQVGSLQQVKRKYVLTHQ